MLEVHKVPVQVRDRRCFYLIKSVWVFWETCVVQKVCLKFVCTSQAEKEKYRRSYPLPRLGTQERSWSLGETAWVWAILDGLLWRGIFYFCAVAWRSKSWKPLHSVAAMARWRNQSDCCIIRLLWAYTKYRITTQDHTCTPDRTKWKSLVRAIKKDND
jgi:hypothetical protein